MQADIEVFDYLKKTLGLESEIELMNWLEISRDSLSGIRTGRLPMGDSIRFQILRKWWATLRPNSHSVGHPDKAVQASNSMPIAIDSYPSFSAKSMLTELQLRLTEVDKDVLGAAGTGHTQSMPVDGELLEAYKVFKGCATDTELANLLGIKRQSISMVRSGRNKLGPIPLLKIFEDVMDVGHLGLQAAVQSSEALMVLITQGKSAGVNAD